MFALGSSAYPNFCNFGKYLDNLLGDLGGERLVEVTCGDELAGQEQQFKKWAAEVFKVCLISFFWKRFFFRVEVATYAIYFPGGLRHLLSGRRSGHLGGDGGTQDRAIGQSQQSQDGSSNGRTAN